MRISTFFIFLFFAVSIVNGQPASRGAQSEPLKDKSTGTVRALVIGISEYKEIEPLQYADRDALEFSNYLKSRAGGSVLPANIQLLLNEDANIGKIITALQWLKEESKAGDKVIIYFSGHGDVETLTDAQNGYLLTYNSPKKVYVAGALPISLLKDYITTLGNKKVSSVVITDACRSGKLAGGQEGARMTSTALLNQWNNEIKIMSCQPGQFSLEGKEWGGGRGAFSYHLIDGLTGMADKNKDNEVSLAELEQYVSEKLTVETQKLQEPIFEGKSKYSTSMSLVDSADLARLLFFREKRSETPTMAGLKSAASVYTDKDTVAMRIFEEFETALRNGKLISPKDSAAADYFRKLEAYRSDAQLTRIARRNLTAALLNHVQEMFNNYLDGKKFLRSEDTRAAIPELELTMSLLGDQHPFYRTCRARKFFMEAASLSNLFAEETITDSLLNTTLALLDEAEKNEPGAAFIYLSKGELYLKRKDFSQAEEWLLKARDASPSWVMPYYALGWAYNGQKRTKEAIAVFEKAISLDTTMRSFECTRCAFLHLGEMYQDMNNSRKALEYYEKAIKADSSFSQAYLFAYSAVIGNMKMRDLLSLDKKLKKAEIYLHRGKPWLTENELHAAFGMGYYIRLQTSIGKKAKRQNFDSAVYHLELANKAEPEDLTVIYLLADLYYTADKPDMAMDYYYQALGIDSLDPEAWLGLAEVNSDLGDLENALYYANKGLSLSETDSFYLAELYFIRAEIMLYQRNNDEESVSEDQIVSALEEAAKAGFEDKSYLKYVFSPLKKNKRYQALLKEYYTKKKT